MNFEALIADQGFAVAIAVLLILTLIWFAKRLLGIIEKHIERNTEALGILKSAVDSQTEGMKEFASYVRTRDQNGGRR